jgi:hypothetical protein
MSQDDDDDDDAKLRSLRAVWLAMPDEDPPERGLDALMAAARTKATQMAEGSSELPQSQPSWWEKFVAGFRRPAVLALATVLVLVAGAVFVGNRGMKASAPSNGNPGPSNEDVPTERREHESLKQEAPPPPTQNDNAAPRPHLATPEAPGGQGEGVVKESVQPNDHWDAVVLDPPQVETTTAQNAKDREKKEQAAKREKLLDEAKMAAARGDCSNARVVARQLEQQDLGYYRSRVAPDPGIADCLVDRKAAGATTGRATAAPDSATIQPAD